MTDRYPTLDSLDMHEMYDRQLEPVQTTEDYDDGTMDNLTTQMVNKEYNNVTEAMENVRIEATSRKEALAHLTLINKHREDQELEPLNVDERARLLRAMAPSGKDQITRAFAAQREADEMKERERLARAAEEGATVQVKVKLKCGYRDLETGFFVHHTDYIYMTPEYADDEDLRTMEELKHSTRTCAACWKAQAAANVDDWESINFPEVLIGSPGQITFGRSVRHKVISAFDRLIADVADGDEHVYDNMMNYRERAMSWNNAGTWCEMNKFVSNGQTMILTAVKIPAKMQTINAKLPALPPMA